MKPSDSLKLLADQMRILGWTTDTQTVNARDHTEFLVKLVEEEAGRQRDIEEAGEAGA